MNFISEFSSRPLTIFWTHKKIIIISLNVSSGCHKTLYFGFFYSKLILLLSRLRERPNRTDEKLYIKWCEKKIQEECEEESVSFEKLYRKFVQKVRTHWFSGPPWHRVYTCIHKLRNLQFMICSAYYFWNEFYIFFCI